MKLGIFGGTFDPPHLAHLHLAVSALKTGKIDKVVFIPTSKPPHKERADITKDEDRYEMTKLLTADNEQLCVSDIELQRKGLSYTIHTLHEIQRIYPNAELRLLIGADMALTFDSWRCAKEIIDIAPPLIAARPGYEFDANFGTSLPEKLPLEYRQILREGIFRINEVDLSSTQVRELIDNKKLSELSKCLPENIISYIRKKIFIL